MTRDPRRPWLALALLSPAAWSCCVAASTRVRTPRGEVAAGSLVVGDRVESVEIAAGRAVEGVIVQIRRATRECVALRWSGGGLVCTPDHPLYSPERGDYRPASDWITGDARLLLARVGESFAPVVVEASAACAGVHEVVDLSLAAEPRNFVAAGIVAHNKSLALSEDEGDPVEITREGPMLSLTATEGSRAFRIRVCEGDGDLTPSGSFRLRVTSTAAPAPADAMSLWLAMYTLGDGEGASVDGGVPGELTLGIDGSRFPEATCDVGLVVGFDRVDAADDGVVAVEWSATLTHWEALDDALSLTIDEA